MTQSSQPFVIAGPTGPLQALLDRPTDDAGRHVGVVCHPHPLHGGAMTNKVAHILARTFNDLGMPVIRFNFRGVGASEGTFDHGRGETEDALAAVAAAHAQFGNRSLWLGGFSFGAAVAIQAATRTATTALVSVAPAVSRVSGSDTVLPSCPWLVVQGDQDELVASDATRKWIASLAHPPELLVLEGADHFFHGRLNDVRDGILRWADSRQLNR